MKVNIPDLADDIFGRMREGVKADLEALGPEVRALTERVLLRAAFVGSRAFLGEKVPEQTVAEVQAQIAGLESAAAAVAGKAINQALFDVAVTAMKVGSALLVA